MKKQPVTPAPMPPTTPERKLEIFKVSTQHEIDVKVGTILAFADKLKASTELNSKTTPYYVAEDAGQVLKAAATIKVLKRVLTTLADSGITAVVELCREQLMFTARRGASTSDVCRTEMMYAEAEAWANATNSAQQFEKWYKDDKS